MRSAAIVAGTQESLRGELATRLSPGALDGRMMCTKNGVLSKFDLLAGELAEKWDEQVSWIGETIGHEKAIETPHRGSSTQRRQGWDDDRDRPWGCLEPLLDRKSTRLNSSHLGISYAVFCLKKKI